MSRRRKNWSFANWCDRQGAKMVVRAYVRAERLMAIGQRWKKWSSR